MEHTLRVADSGADCWHATTWVLLLIMLSIHQCGGVASAQTWPGSTGKSGVNGDPAIDRASVEAFARWRGRPAAVAVVFTDRRDWEAMTRGNGWIYDNFEGFAGQLVISQGLLPNDRPQDLPGCAAGQYDAYWRDFGRGMVERGRANSIVRLGWEFNGDWYSWGATNTQQWIACYRHAALAIRSTNPQVTLDWTVNSKGTPPELCGGVSTNCYPGDDVVDIIGIDNYDMGPSAASEAEFLRIADAPEGLNWLFAFATRHGKKFSVGEWAIAPGSEYNTAGENPRFISWMHSWFASHAQGLAYEAYFTHCDAGVESNLYRTSRGCRRNIRAGMVYRYLFRAR